MLTPEQAKLAADNEPLIKYYINLKHLNSYFDDAYGILALALCRAAASYKPDSQVQFSTYACTAFANAMHNEHKRMQRLKTLPDDICISLDYKLKDGHSDRYDSWSGQHDMRIAQIELDLLITQVATPAEQNKLQLMRDGYTLTEIGKMQGVSRQAIQQSLKKIKSKLKEELEV